MAAPCVLDWKSRAEKLQLRWNSLQERGRGDALLLKASATLQSLNDACAKDMRNCNHTSCLRLYTQAVLDITFYEENQLVDKDFPGDDSLQKVRELIQMLSDPEHLVEESNFHKQCLEDGVYYLQKMLHTRNPVHVNDEDLVQDINTATLLAKGIFSDIHVLSLMYCGEMCFWAVTYCMEVVQTSGIRPNSETRNNRLNFKEVGESVLETYVGVCEGPLSGQGWSTDNAKKILQSLKKEKI